MKAFCNVHDKIRCRGLFSIVTESIRSTFNIDPSRILKRPVIKINGGSTPHITKVWDQDITTI